MCLSCSNTRRLVGILLTACFCGCGTSSGPTPAARTGQPDSGPLSDSAIPDIQADGSNADGNVGVDAAPEADVVDGSVPDSMPPAPMVHSSGQQIVDPGNAPLLLQCVNVDGWLMPIPYLVSDSGHALSTSPSEFVKRLDEVVGTVRAEKFWKDWRDNHTTETDFERIAALGFNCVRLVVYHRSITTIDNGQPVLDDSRIKYVDSALECGKKHGIYIVVDLHSVPGGQNALATVSDIPSTDLVARLWEGPTAEDNRTATVAIWRALADRYRNESIVAGYDLLNEPALPSGIDASELVSLYERIITAIRSVDTEHMVIVEGDALAHDFSMFTAPLDGNMAYEFHAYALAGFEGWATPETQDLQPYLTLRTDQNRPIWLGEFGEQTKDWQVQMISLMEANNVGWAIYPWKRKQTWFWNEVLQVTDSSQKWYALAAYMAQPANGTLPPPSHDDAEAGMAEIIEAIKLNNCTENAGLASSLLSP